jgi:glycosyltransferase involved in cell wall biosynthesis
MKLVVATPLYPPEVGGPATYAKLLEEGLPERGIEVALVKFSDVRGLPKLVRHYAYYRRVLKAARSADAVLALDPVSVGMPACRAAENAGKPFFVKIVGDYAWEQGRQRFGVTEDLDAFVKNARVPLLVRILRAAQKRVAEHAERIIVPSTYLKGIVEAWGIPSEKIEVIHNGIELPRELPVIERPGGFLVVSSGRRVPWKGFEALERVVKGEAGWHCHIASGVSREEALAWAKAADVFVLNSTYEGLSHALIEAMMLGTPVVATSAGGNGELVEDGATGLLVSAGDDEALHNALKKVAGDPSGAKARAAEGRARMSEFSTTAMLDATAAFFTQYL